MMSGRRARPKRRVKEIERVITPLQARGLEFLLAKGGDVKFQLTPYSKLALGT